LYNDDSNCFAIVGVFDSTVEAHDDEIFVRVPVVVFAADDPFIVFVGVVGIPHIFDSVELTNLSFGLLGLHIAAFCCGVNDNDDDDVLLLNWPWATPKFPNSVIDITNTILAAMIVVIDIIPRDIFCRLMVPMFLLFSPSRGK
jgi:hypothetical protein